MSRYSRQNVVVPDTIFDEPVAVIGCGAIGRQVTLQLASMGVQQLMLIDFDKVDETNICTQGYSEGSIGAHKVEMLEMDILEINSSIEVVSMKVKYGPRSSGLFEKGAKKAGWEETPRTVFCCVDSITARKDIYEACHKNIDFFCDGRMTAESLRIITITDNKEYYPETLFEASEAHRGSCTAKSTIYCANIAAGLMCSQYTKYLRAIEPTQDFMLNILSEDLFPIESEVTV